MIHQYSRWNTSDGARFFIVLGKWSKGTEVVSYEILDVHAEKMIVLQANVWEDQIREGKVIRVN
jgi:hypothetical protein